MAKFRVILNVKQSLSLLNAGARTMLIERAGSKASTPEKAEEAKAKMAANIDAWISEVKTDEDGYALNALIHFGAVIAFDEAQGLAFLSAIKSCLANNEKVPFAAGTDIAELQEGGQVSFLMSVSDMLSFCMAEGVYMAAEEASHLVAKALKGATIVATFEYCKAGDSYGDGDYTKTHWRTSFEVDELSGKGDAVIEEAIKGQELVKLNRPKAVVKAAGKTSLSALEIWLSKQALNCDLKTAKAVIGDIEFEDEMAKECYDLLKDAKLLKKSGTKVAEMVS